MKSRFFFENDTLQHSNSVMQNKHLTIYNLQSTHTIVQHVQLHISEVPLVLLSEYLHGVVKRYNKNV